jgi:hypothetical protein
MRGATRGRVRRISRRTFAFLLSWLTPTSLFLRGTARSTWQRRNHLDSFYGDWGVPPLDRGDAPVIAENAHRCGIEKEVTSCRGRKANPSSHEHSEDVPVSKKRNIPLRGAHAFDH